MFLRTLINQALPVFDLLSIYQTNQESSSGLPCGALYWKYSETRRELRKFGWFSSAAGIEEEASLEFPDQEATNTELRSSIEPWDTTLTMWDNTRDFRLALVERSDTFEQYISGYACMEDSRSKILLPSDGEYELTKKYQWSATRKMNEEVFLRNLVPIINANKRYIDRSLMKFFDALSRSDLAVYTRFLIGVSLMPFCMKPPTKRYRTGNEVEEDVATTARATAYRNFIPIFATVEEAKEHARKQSRGVYPFAYLILNESMSTAIFFIQCGVYWWSYESSDEDGVAAFIKVHFALGCHYFQPKFGWLLETIYMNIVNADSEKKYACTRSKDIARKLKKP